MANSIKLPYAYSLKEKRLVHISQAIKGEDYYRCTSCEMQVRPRGGDGTEREEHFYHKLKAEKKCDISPWVSIRSMALQLIDEVRTFCVPNWPIVKKNNYSTNILPILVLNKDTPHNRDIITLNGKFHIHILTPEHPLKEIKSYFTHELILIIDITSVLTKHISEQDNYLQDIVVKHLDYKKWYVPNKSIVKLTEFKVGDQEKSLQSFPKRLSFIQKERINPIDVKHSEHIAISKIFSYYREVEAQIGFYKEKGVFVHSFKPEQYFRAYLINQKVYCCIEFGKHFFIYQIKNEIMNILYKCKNIYDVESFIQSEKEKENIFALDIKFSDMSNDDWTTHMRMKQYAQRVNNLRIASNMHKKFTYIDKANNLYLITYRYEFFLVANIAASLVLFELKWNQVELKKRFRSIDKLKKHLDWIVDKELEKADKLF